MTDVPRVRARLRLKDNGRVWRLVEPCPFCGKTHFHSAGLGGVDPSPYLGLRAAPCKGGRYRIVADPGVKRLTGDSMSTSFVYVTSVTSVTAQSTSVTGLNSDVTGVTDVTNFGPVRATRVRDPNVPTT